MSSNMASSINLCPINFVEFGKVNAITNNLEATLLFSKLKFHEINSRLRKSGITWIARSREQIASWYGFGIKKTDRLLSFLEKMGLIKKKVGLWYGKKRLFIATASNINTVAINLKVLNTLTDVAGSIQAALLFSKIAYNYTNSKIENEGKKWCCLKKQDLANWSGLSIRTIDSILEILVKKGLILKKKFVYREKLQTHFHVPDFITTILRERTKENHLNEQKNVADTKLNSSNCLEQPAEKAVSIKIRSKQKQTNNITQENQLSTTVVEKQSDINFDIIVDNKLSNRQLNYLAGALKNTIARNQLKISSPNELWEQLKFSVLHLQQHRNIQSFKHAVSRFMKILADRNWKTPIGFSNHSEHGIQLKNNAKQQREHWEKSKESERKACQHYRLSASIRQNINDSATETELTEKALYLAKRVRQLAEKSENTKDVSIMNFIDKLTYQMQDLIRQGANRTIIIDFLRKKCI